MTDVKKHSFQITFDLTTAIAEQKKEIAYLREHHPAFFTQELILDENPRSIAKFNENITALNKINAHIIQQHIDRKKRLGHERDFDVNQDTITNPTEDNDKNIFVLNLNDAHITRLPITLLQENDEDNYWENLTQLNCASNKITTLDLRNLKALEVLSCNNNNLIHINIDGLINLKFLKCDTGNLTELNLQGLTALKQINCQGNKLTTLDFTDLSELEALNCSNNKFTAPLDIKKLTKLRALEWNDNAISYFPIKLQGKSLEEIEHQYLEKETEALFKWLGVVQEEEKIEIIRKLGKERFNCANCVKYLGPRSWEKTYRHYMKVLDTLQATYTPALIFSNKPKEKVIETENKNKIFDDNTKILGSWTYTPRKQ